MFGSILMMGSWVPHVAGLFPNKNQGANRQVGRTRKPGVRWHSGTQDTDSVNSHI